MPNETQINIDEITDIKELKALRGDQFMERETVREQAARVEERTTQAITALTNRIATIQEEEALKHQEQAITAAENAKKEADKATKADKTGEQLAAADAASQDPRGSAKDKAATPNV
jgi:hypothetical protein